MTTRARRLSIPTMIAFGSGEAAGAFKNTSWAVLLLFYYQQVVGVEAALVGLAIAISVTMDAITDPLVGAWSDRIRSKWGRRHPMLLASAIPLAATFVLLFSPPQGMSNTQGFFWLLTFGILVRTSYTFYNIPHLALGAEMTQDYYQRSTLFAYSSFFGFMSVAVVYGLITGFFFPTTPEFDPGFLNASAYPTMSVTFAIVMLVAILTCVTGTRKEIPYLRPTQERPSIGLKTVFTEMYAVFGNRSFRAVFFGLILGSLVGGVESAFNPFIGIHFWDLRTEQLFYLAFVGLLAFPVSFALIPWLTRKLDKRMCIILSLAAWIIAANTPICLRLLEVSWFPDNDSAWILPIYLASSAVGVLVAPIIGTTANSMLADIADEHELESGVRREGVLYSVRAFSGKATAAIGTLFGGILLSAIEFPAQATRGEVPEDVVWHLGFIAGPATSIFSLLAVGFYLMYRIDRARHVEIVRLLAERN